MAFTIPAGTFDIYFEVVDELINNAAIGANITLFYPETATEVVDTSHSLNLVGGKKTNFGPDGNLTPFNPKAGGATYSQVESKEIIRCRWYPTEKSWNKLGVVAIPETKVILIAKIENWEKIQRANQIGSDFGGIIERYVLAGKMQPWGFTGSDGADRYLLAQLKEA